MINFVTWNILASPSQALVNTVNTKGVMWKWIALQFKLAFPCNYSIYRKSCLNDMFKIWDIITTFENGKYVINFPTKDHWKNDSKLEYIDLWLLALKKEIEKYNITSIALPKLWCWLWNLDWVLVKGKLEKFFDDGCFDWISVYVYE